MRFTQQAFAAVGVALAVTSAGAGTWGPAQHIVTPATREHSEGGIESVSCPSNGSCVAVGTYEVSGVPEGADRPYLVTRRKNGTWSKIEILPGSAGLDPGLLPRATANAISCPTAGNCSVIGHFITTSREHPSSYVDTEKNGVWGTPERVPGLVKIGAGNSAELQYLACQSAGNCVAGGSYIGRSDIQFPFVVSEVNGVWGKAQNIPGISFHTVVVSFSYILGVSCPASGSCLALGFYSSDNVDYLFVSTRTNGVFGRAKKIPGAPVAALSCAPAGPCTVATAFGRQQSKIGTITEQNGVWGSEQLVPGTLSAITQLDAISVACPAAGDCSLDWYDSTQGAQTLSHLAAQKKGTWGKPALVGGLGKVNSNFDDLIFGVSCASPGNCATGGEAQIKLGDGTESFEAFVVGESNGVWRGGVVVPGITKLDGSGTSSTVAVSCWAANHCVAGGLYSPPNSTSPSAFLTTQS